MPLSKEHTVSVSFKVHSLTSKYPCAERLVRVCATIDPIAQLQSLFLLLSCRVFFFLVLFFLLSLNIVLLLVLRITMTAAVMIVIAILLQLLMI